MTTENSTTESKSGSHQTYWLAIFTIAAAAFLLSMLIRNSIPSSHSGLPAGETVPELHAVGWVNGGAPPQTPPQGKIRVMHAWFTTCPACLRESAELVKLQALYKSQGVEFVGLTFEPAQRLGDVEQFLEKTGITWVNGYGASETLKEMGVEYFPSIWIIDSEGQILWSRDSKVPLEQAIESALAGKLVAQS